MESQSLPMNEMRKISFPDDEQHSEEDISIHVELVKEKGLFFHLMMFLYGVSLSVLFTNWVLSGGWMYFVFRIYVSWGIRIAQQLALFLLFAWSLMAPKCCPGKDFLDN